MGFVFSVFPVRRGQDGYLCQRSGTSRAPSPTNTEVMCAVCFMNKAGGRTPPLRYSGYVCANFIVMRGTSWAPSPTNIEIVFAKFSAQKIPLTAALLPQLSVYSGDFLQTKIGMYDTPRNYVLYQITKAACSSSCLQAK